MMQRVEYEASIKVVLIGAPTVGKSSLFDRFTDKNTFNPHIEKTSGIEIATKIVTMQNGAKFKLNISDRAGQEDTHSKMRQYFQDADVVILVGDISDRRIFKNLDHWRGIARRFLNVNQSIIFVATKSDLRSKLQCIDEAHLAQYANDNQLLGQHGQVGYISTSAQDGINIDEVLMTVCDIYLEKNPDLAAKLAVRMERQRQQNAALSLLARPQARVTLTRFSSIEEAIEAVRHYRETRSGMFNKAIYAVPELFRFFQGKPLMAVVKDKASEAMEEALNGNGSFEDVVFEHQEAFKDMSDRLSVLLERILHSGLTIPEAQAGLTC